MAEELITGRADLWLAVEYQSTANGIELTFRLKSPANYLLHWGLTRKRSGSKKKKGVRKEKEKGVSSYEQLQEKKKKGSVLMNSYKGHERVRRQNETASDF
jgi:hypothetical protein